MFEPVQLVPILSLAGQVTPGANIDVTIGEGIAGGAAGAFLTTLVVGAILVAVAPDYTRRRMAAVLEDPVGTFVYGIVSLVFVALVTLVLVVTIVGILVAIPFALAAYLAWAVGAAVAYLAIADRLVGHEEGWLVPLLVAAGINGALALTGIGGIVAIGIGAAGFGAVLRSVLG